jgi:sortase A
MVERGRIARWAGAALCGLGAWQVAEAGWIHVKAALAQALMGRAWARAQSGASEPRSWPWADTWPIARLSVPALGASVYVLADASGRSLAFAPGHVAGTAAPGESGVSVISAHRDTHFAFLRRLSSEHAIEVERRDGRRSWFRMIDARIVDARNIRLRDAIEASPVLVLVTCYPFDGVAWRTPLRYVVTAQAVDGLGE